MHNISVSRFESHDSDWKGSVKKTPDVGMKDNFHGRRGRLNKGDNRSGRIRTVTDGEDPGRKVL